MTALLADDDASMLIQFLRNAARLAIAVALASWPIVEPAIPQRVSWNQPFHPFRIVGNVYFVGVAGLSSFLIVSPEGSILLDGALRESAPHIAENIVKLGFRLDQVKYLLNSHVHYDHAGGLAELKRLTGAAMILSARDAPPLKIGNSDVPPVIADRIVADHDVVRLGDTALTARMTPGHTRGCTTWTTTTTENGRPYEVVFYCGTSMVAPLVDNARYPEIVADYEHTFRVFRTMRADVFLEGHPFRWDMEGKVRRMRDGPNPFVDPTEFSRFVERSERDFRVELQQELAGIPTLVSPAK